MKRVSIASRDAEFASLHGSWVPQVVEEVTFGFLLWEKEHFFEQLGGDGDPVDSHRLALLALGIHVAYPAAAVSRRRIGDGDGSVGGRAVPVVVFWRPTIGVFIILRRHSEIV